MTTVDDLLLRLRAAATVNDPFIGEATVGDMRRRSPLWPQHDKWQRIASTDVTDVPPRRVEEYRYFTDRDTAGLPVVFVFDSSGGPTAVRVYSSRDLVADRAPLLPVVDGLAPELPEDDVLRKYFASLPDPDPASSASLFAHDGYIQHSDGRRFTGHAQLLEDFTTMKRNKGGGIHLRHARIGDNGHTLVLECLVPSGRPAVVVYERDGRDRMRAVRIAL